MNGQEATPFSLHDVIQPLFDFYNGQRGKPETRTATLNGWCNLVYIVANDAETNVLRVLFNDAAKCGLGSGSHHVGLVQYDELKPFGEKGACLRELLYLLADNVNASVVRGV